MKINWMLVAQSGEYGAGTALERRLIELRVSAAIAVRRMRRAAKLSQTALASRLGTTQTRISALECARHGVSLDLVARALLVLGASDAQFAAAFNAGECSAVEGIRRRAALPYFRRARKEEAGSVLTLAGGRVGRRAKRGARPPDTGAAGG